MTKKPIKPKPRTVKGFKDSLWGESLSRRRMLEQIQAVYELYGFQQIETPALEYVDVLGKFLPDGDTPEEGIFAFESEDEWVALRYDLTAPLSRVIAQYQDLPKPFRRYQIGKVWRIEKPGAGRFREFTQFDIDTVGTTSILADCEVCAALVDAFEAIGIAAPHLARSLPQSHSLCEIQPLGAAQRKMAGKGADIVPTLRYLEGDLHQAAQKLWP